ncbi:MAG: cysteine peptidase family C39 domain-containing protein [Candidatus Absconditabacteria bacterium]|nr:cysteine peptidase family C39 domain-containing protein [Candidatus Absconditabacteria bacterium]
MKLLTFPELRQFSNYDCGPCSLQAVLAYYNIDIKEGEICKRANTTEEGTNIEDMVRIAEEEGIKCVSKKMTIQEITKYLEKDIPVIIALQARN